jgi:hypothetical protein
LNDATIDRSRIANLSLVSTPGDEPSPAFGVPGYCPVVTVTVSIPQCLSARPFHLFAVTKVTVTTHFVHDAVLIITILVSVPHFGFSQRFLNSGE